MRSGDSGLVPAASVGLFPLTDMLVLAAAGVLLVPTLALGTFRPWQSQLFPIDLEMQTSRAPYATGARETYGCLRGEMPPQPTPIPSLTAPSLAASYCLQCKMDSSLL